MAKRRQTYVKCNQLEKLPIFGKALLNSSNTNGGGGQTFSSITCDCDEPENEILTNPI